MIKEICSIYYYSKNQVKGQVSGHSDPNMVRSTPPSQDSYTYQMWNSYLKEYKRYAMGTIILKTRSEIKVKVTQKWYVTIHQPKMHLHTKIGIPISKNTGDMHQTQYSF